MAEMTLQDWLDRLKPGDTPIFRHTKAVLREFSPRRDELSAKEISVHILADPLATLRLVFLANNRSSRFFGSEVATVEHAILMEGVGVYLDKTLSLPVLEETPQGHDHEIRASLYRLARMAQHAAWQARDFALLDHDLRAEELQVAAVLYYAPEFLFWLGAPDVADQLAQLRREMRSAQAEERTLGFALPPLRAMLLEAWKIPEVTRALLDTQETVNPRNTILRAALSIAHHSRRGWWDPRLLETYQALAEVTNLPIEEVVATVHSNAIRSARAGNWIPATPAAAWLPMEPGEWPQEAQHKQPATSPGSAEQPAATTPEPSPPPLPAAIPAVLEETIDKIGSHLDGSLTMSQMLAIILKGLHSGLGLSRVLFALITPDGKRVKCRFTLGINSDDPLRHFEFSLANKDLFGILMGRMQGIWINADNRGSLWPRIAPQLRAIIARGDFYAMSLHGNGRPIGLIYADRGHGQANGGLDTNTYNDFKRLCSEAAKGLSRVKAT
jgi:hypothetical protein